MPTPFLSLIRLIPTVIDHINSENGLLIIIYSLSVSCVSVPLLRIAYNGSGIYFSSH
ncbi:MAG: hypothetical protein KGV44_08400 [Flavobacteriaceae bacterium]|nr:hypothetical protein [Flavobacteriaceae bacterium]